MSSKISIYLAVFFILCVLSWEVCATEVNAKYNFTDFIHRLSEALKSKLLANPEVLRANISRSLFKQLLQLAYADVKLSLGGNIAFNNSVDFVPSITNHSTSEVAHSSEAKSPVGQLASEVRVLCMVLTHPENHRANVRHVRATWGRRCNRLLFMSTAEDPELSVIKLLVREGYDYLWGKTKAAFRYVYRHYKNDADWFLKADDDTYVVVDNLRLMLSQHHSSDPLYFGCRFKSLSRRKGSQGYMSGGAGYVLSKAALELFVRKGLPAQNKTRGLCDAGDRGPEDAQMGRCLQRVGVKAMDSRDSQGRGRFFPFTPKDHMFPKKDDKTNFWYWDYKYYPSEEGLNCCSDQVISFHYVKPLGMYAMEYLIYHLRSHKGENLNTTRKETKSSSSFDDLQTTTEISDESTDVTNTVIPPREIDFLDVNFHVYKRDSIGHKNKLNPGNVDEASEDIEKVSKSSKHNAKAQKLFYICKEFVKKHKNSYCFLMGTKVYFQRFKDGYSEPSVKVQDENFFKRHLGKDKQ